MDAADDTDDDNDDNDAVCVVVVVFVGPTVRRAFGLYRDMGTLV